MNISDRNPNLLFICRIWLEPASKGWHFRKRETIARTDDELKFDITRTVKLATISWGWTYSEGNREKRGIRVHEECQAGTQWSWKAQSGWTERRRGRTRKQDKSED